MKQSRIESTLESLAAKGEKALTVFLTAGYPNLHDTPGLVTALARAGADIVELGMPFSDPLADGPVIQRSSAAALQNGVTLETILADVAHIRSASDIPLVLMGYINPILSYGAERFFHDARDCGADGIILPELPIEEIGLFSRMIAESHLAHILLVTPMTSDHRVCLIDEASSGFLYCVSHTGVTGSNHGGASREYLLRLNSLVKKNRMLVGFGIASATDAREAAVDADGVIVGSAFLSRLEKEGREKSMEWITEIKNALRTA